MEDAITVGKQWNTYRAFLYELLKADSHLITLRKALEQEPQYLQDIAIRIFGEKPGSLELLVSLVDLATRARLSDDDQPLVPARYHLFVRAIEGAYASLRPSRKLYLERVTRSLKEIVHFPSSRSHHVDNVERLIWWANTRSPREESF